MGIGKGSGSSCRLRRDDDARGVAGPLGAPTRLAKATRPHPTARGANAGGYGRPGPAAIARRAVGGTMWCPWVRTGDNRLQR